MRFLLDQGLPRTAVELLRQAGHDAVHVGDVGMAGAEDGEILERARSEGRVVLTLDADFHMRLVMSGAAGPSVIRIRIEGLRAQALTRLVLDVVARCGEDIDMGAMVTVESSRVRVRTLPFGEARDGR